MIEIRDLTRRFGDLTAVDQVSFTVGKGEVLGFLGPNGAGKSTTMKMITGFLSPSSGSVSVCGHDLDDDPMAVKRSIGYLPEGAPGYGDMTPATFLDFVAEVRGLGGEAKTRAIESVRRKVHLEGVMDQAIETLSKGYRRRVGLAQAILHDPPVLVLDEPTDGLDPNQKHEVRGLIRQMAADKAIILSTHILEEVEAVCTRAIIIARGRIVVDGTPAELETRSPRHNAVSLAVRGAEADAVGAELGALEDVASVETCASGNGTAHVLVHPRDGRSIVSEVSTRVRERAWEVDELHVERGRLDEVFRELTGEEMS